MAIAIIANLSFLGFAIFGILALYHYLRKLTRAKLFGTISGICFLALVVIAGLPPPPKHMLKVTAPSLTNRDKVDIKGVTGAGYELILYADGKKIGKQKAQKSEKPGYVMVRA